MSTMHARIVQELHARGFRLPAEAERTLGEKIAMVHQKRRPVLVRKLRRLDHGIGAHAYREMLEYEKNFGAEVYLAIYEQLDVNGGPSETLLIARASKLQPRLEWLPAKQNGAPEETAFFARSEFGVLFSAKSAPAEPPKPAPARQDVPHQRPLFGGR